MPARRHGPLTAKQTQKIQASYREGDTLETLAKRYRCSRSTIWAHVEPRRPSELAVARARIKELEAQLAEARAEVARVCDVIENCVGESPFPPRAELFACEAV